MSTDNAFRDPIAVDRLLDEIEQLRTALEASSEEVNRLVEDRDRLLRRVTVQARELQTANVLNVASQSDERRRSETALRVTLHATQEQEELRVAFEEMQVLTEELEVANNSLHETNKALDSRVEERTRELQAKNMALTESELRFRTLIEGMPQLVWRAASGGDWTWASPQWSTYTGQPPEESEGSGWLRALHPDDQEPARAAWSRAQGATTLDMEVRILHCAEGRYRHFRTRATAVRAADGTILEWLGTSTDVDDLLQLQDRQQVLVAELQHRTRNLMGVVRSMADKTIARSADLTDFRLRYSDRLAALARVQGLLSRLNEWDRVTFDELIRSEMSAINGEAERVVLTGPEGVALRSSTVQTFALAIHELATNAMKYGALSQPQGQLDVHWRVERDVQDGRPWLHVDWRESGVTMPADTSIKGGSGRELITRALPYQLKAKTTYVMAEDGVHCTIALPVSERGAGHGGG